MQREEKQQEAILDAIIMRVNEIKNSIGHMIMILETQYETINWPSFLDNFALLSSHVSFMHQDYSMLDYVINDLKYLYYQ